MAAPDAAGCIQLKCSLSNKHVLSAQESLLKLLVQLEASPGQQSRPGLNLCLTMDRSFSMQDDHKLEWAKQAAISLVDSLSPADLFSLVEFGTDVRVAVEAGPAADRASLKQAIERIKAHSATNLYEALHAAAAQVYHVYDERRINRVILLSDGVPTEGITSDERIEGIARTAGSLGIGISTLGLGEDYDELLLSSISELSSGNHYYIRSPADIPLVLNQELARLQSIIARDVEIHVRPPEGAEVILANARYQSRCDTSEGVTTIRLDDMERSGIQPILLEIRFPAADAGTELSTHVTVTYTDVANGLPDQLISALAVATATPDPEQIRQGIDRAIIQRFVELTSFQAAAAAVAAGTEGSAATAEVIDELHKRAAALRRVDSRCAPALDHLAETIIDQGGITAEVAKRTVVARIAAQQGHPVVPGADRPSAS